MSPVCMFFGKLALPLLHIARNEKRFIYNNRYKKNIQKTRIQIQSYQLERLKKLVVHAYHTVPYYREVFDHIQLKPSDIKGLSDITKIPVLEKRMILTNLEKLKSTKRYKLTEHTSGGSTGNKVTVYWDKRFEEITRAVWMRDLHLLGIEPGDKSAWIWGSPYETKPLQQKIIKKILWRLNRRIIFNTLHYTDEELRLWLTHDFRRFKPAYIYGYANPLCQIARFILKNNMKIPKLKMVISTAEKLNYREVMEEAFGCPVINQYGCREVPVIAIEDRYKVMHTSDDYVIVETDKDGRIIITPLENFGMPLLRYVNGDMGTFRKESLEKSRSPFKSFNFEVGRIAEMLRNTKNERISFLPIGLKIAKETKTVNEFQLIQKSFRHVHLNIVSSSPIDDHDILIMKQIIAAKLGCEEITIDYHESFPLEPSGKKIVFKCEIHEDETPTSI
ncbi:phenylacetate--CoA ligase family protein [Acidobacteriota bacterium]